MNFSGCGNTLNCNHPMVMELILDSLQHWVNEYHVDGFRFDLGSVLCRGTDGLPLDAPPLVRVMAKDVVLSKCKIISELWDCGGLYLVEKFPNWDHWVEWNGKYREGDEWKTTFKTKRGLYEWKIAIFNTALNIQNFRAAMKVPVALGLDPTVVNSVHRLINDGAGSILPSGFHTALLDGIFNIGRAQLSEAILNERNPIGTSRLARLKHIFEEGKGLQLQFPAEDLGFRYLKGALVSDRNVVYDDTENLPTGRRRDYIPSSYPGSRLPHMNVRPLSRISDEDSFSTLDLISGDKVELILIITPVESSYDLARATLKAAEKYKVVVKVCVIWPSHGNNVVRTAMVKNAAVFLMGNGVDIVKAKKSPSSPSWWDLCQMNDRGAILVRPDEHIAWRARSEIEDPLFKIERVNESYKAKANQSRSQPHFQPGDLVWLHMRKERFPTRRKHKLMQRSEGPFRVLERVGKKCLQDRTTRKLWSTFNLQCGRPGTLYGGRNFGDQSFSRWGV